MRFAQFSWKSISLWKREFSGCFVKCCKSGNYGDKVVLMLLFTWKKEVNCTKSLAQSNQFLWLFLVFLRADLMQIAMLNDASYNVMGCKWARQNHEKGLHHRGRKHFYFYLERKKEQFYCEVSWHCFSKHSVFLARLSAGRYNIGKTFKSVFPMLSSMSSKG